MNERSIPTEKIETPDFTMNYFKFGSGSRTFVILPGLSVQSVMNSAAAVAEAYDSMADEFTIYVFDRRSELPHTYSVYDMAHDTAEAMIALGLHDVYLFGASQGGMMAMVIAVEYPELVRKLALGSSAAKIYKSQYRAVEGWIDMAKRKDPVNLYLDFGQKIYPPDVFDQYREALISAGKSVTEDELKRFIILAEGMHGFDISEKLKEIRCPVLAIGAVDDAVLGPYAAEEIARRLESKPDFDIHLYDGYGHASFDTAPDYKERLLKFFTE